MRAQGENRRSATPSSQRFISPSRSIELREDDGKPYLMIVFKYFSIEN